MKIKAEAGLRLDLEHCPPAGSSAASAAAEGRAVEIAVIEDHAGEGGSRVQVFVAEESLPLERRALYFGCFYTRRRGVDAG